MRPVTSEPTRDPATDHLLTAQNAALVVIDYQPSQVQAVTSIDGDLLVDNIVSVARLARTFQLPVVLSTVNVANGQGPTVPELRAVLADSLEIDRTQINSWEDVEFRRAVEATGRRKLIMAALWTEMCLVFPALDAMREGFEVYPVVDAVGGTSMEAHRAGLEQDRAGRRAADRLGGTCRRAPTRLGPDRDRRRRRGHRPDDSPPRHRVMGEGQGADADAAMSEASKFNLEKPAAELAASLAQGPALYELPLADVRKAVDGAQADDTIPMPDVEEAWFTVPAEVGDVRFLIIKPRPAEAQLPVVLYMHGGGWVLGSAASHGRLARELAVAADAAVVFVDYTLAPEARYPVQVEQCYAVARWVTAHGASHGLDPSRSQSPVTRPAATWRRCSASWRSSAAT